MLILPAVIFGVVWIFEFAVYHVTSAALHLLLLLAVVAVVLHFARGTRRTS